MSNWLDFSNNSNKFKQSYFSGFIDISGGNVNLRNDGEIELYNKIDLSNPKFSIKSDKMNIYDGISSYYDVSNSQLIYLKNVSGDIQTQINKLNTLTQFINSDSSSNSGGSGTFQLGTNTSIGGNLNVGTDTSIIGNLSVNTNSSIGGSLNIGSDSSIGGNLNVNTNSSIGGSLNVGTNSSIGGNLVVNDNFVLLGDASLNGNLLLGGDISINGNIRFPLGSINPNSILGGTVGVFIGAAEKVTFDDDLFALVQKGPVKGEVATDAVFDKNITVLGDASLNGNTYLKNVYILNDLSVSGIITAVTEPKNENSNKVATTAYVQNQGYATPETLFRQFLQ